MRHSLPMVLIIASVFGPNVQTQPSPSPDSLEFQYEPLFKAEELPETAFDRKPAVIENSITEAKDQDQR